MTFHVDSLAREYMRSGMSAQDAEALLGQRFGSVLHLKERGHDVRRAAVVEDLLRDVRYALRALRLGARLLVGGRAGGSAATLRSFPSSISCCFGRCPIRRASSSWWCTNR